MPFPLVSSSSVSLISIAPRPTATPLNRFSAAVVAVAVAAALAAVSTVVAVVVRVALSGDVAKEAAVAMLC